MRESQRYYRHHPDMVSREILGEMILVPVRKKATDMENLYTLNQTGAFAWKLFDGEQTVDQIRDQIVREFEVNEAEAQSDLDELIAQLLEIEALEVV